MPLDPQTQAVLDFMAASGMPPVHTQTVADARGAMLAMGAMRGEPEPVANVEDREIPGCHTECCVGMCPIVKRLFLTLYAYRISSPLGML